MQRLKEDGEFVMFRAQRDGYPGLANPSTGPPGSPTSILVLAPVVEQPSPRGLRMLERELALASELDPSWAARPLALMRHEGRTVFGSGGSRR
jgi:hypothetical protein